MNKELIDINVTIDLINKSDDLKLISEINELIINYCDSLDQVYKYVTEVKSLTEKQINSILNKAFSMRWHDLDDIPRFLKVKGCPKELLYKYILKRGNNHSDVLTCIEEAIKDGISEDIIKGLTNRYLDICYYYSDLFLEEVGTTDEFIKLYNLTLNDSYNICKKLLYSYCTHEARYFISLINSCPKSMISEIINLVEKEDIFYFQFGILILSQKKCSDEEKIIIYNACIRYKEINYIIKYIEEFGISYDRIAEDLIKNTGIGDYIFNCFYRNYYKMLSPEVNKKMIDYFLNEKLYSHFFEDPLLSTVDPQILLNILSINSEAYIIKKLLFSNKSPFKDNKELIDKLKAIVLKKRPIDINVINVLYNAKVVNNSFLEEIADELIQSPDHNYILINNIRNFLYYFPDIKNVELIKKLISLGDIKKAKILLDKCLLRNEEKNKHFDFDKFMEMINNNYLANFIFTYTPDELKEILKRMSNEYDKYALIIKVYYDFINKLIINPGITIDKLNECQLLDLVYKNELKKEKGKSYNIEKRGGLNEN